MFNSVEWDNVLQSIIDFWLPIFGWIVVIILIIIVIRCILKKRNNT